MFNLSWSTEEGCFICFEEYLPEISGITYGTWLLFRKKEETGVDPELESISIFGPRSMFYNRTPSTHVIFWPSGMGPNNIQFGVETAYGTDRLRAIALCPDIQHVKYIAEMNDREQSLSTDDFRMRGFHKVMYRKYPIIEIICEVPQLDENINLAAVSSLTKGCVSLKCFDRKSAEQDQFVDMIYGHILPKTPILIKLEFFSKIKDNGHSRFKRARLQQPLYIWNIYTSNLFKNTVCRKVQDRLAAVTDLNSAKETQTLASNTVTGNGQGELNKFDATECTATKDDENTNISLISDSDYDDETQTLALEAIIGSEEVDPLYFASNDDENVVICLLTDSDSDEGETHTLALNAIIDSEEVDPLYFATNDDENIVISLISDSDSDDDMINASETHKKLTYIKVQLEQISGIIYCVCLSFLVNKSDALQPELKCISICGPKNLVDSATPPVQVFFWPSGLGPNKIQYGVETAYGFDRLRVIALCPDLYHVQYIAEINNRKETLPPDKCVLEYYYTLEGRQYYVLRIISEAPRLCGNIDLDIVDGKIDCCVSFERSIRLEKDYILNMTLGHIIPKTPMFTKLELRGKLTDDVPSCSKTGLLQQIDNSGYSWDIHTSSLLKQTKGREGDSLATVSCKITRSEDGKPKHHYTNDHADSNNNCNVLCSYYGKYSPYTNDEGGEHSESRTADGRTEISNAHSNTAGNGDGPFVATQCKKSSLTAVFSSKLIKNEDPADSTGLSESTDSYLAAVDDGQPVAKGEGGRTRKNTHEQTTFCTEGQYKKCSLTVVPISKLTGDGKAAGSNTFKLNTARPSGSNKIIAKPNNVNFTKQSQPCLDSALDQSIVSGPTKPSFNRQDQKQTPARNSSAPPNHHISSSMPFKLPVQVNIPQQHQPAKYIFGMTMPQESKSMRKLDDWVYEGARKGIYKEISPQDVKRIWNKWDDKYFNIKQMITSHHSMRLANRKAPMLPTNIMRLIWYRRTTNADLPYLQAVMEAQQPGHACRPIFNTQSWYSHPLCRVLHDTLWCMLGNDLEANYVIDIRKEAQSLRNNVPMKGYSYIKVCVKDIFASIDKEALKVILQRLILSERYNNGKTLPAEITLRIVDLILGDTTLFTHAGRTYIQPHGLQLGAWGAELLATIYLNHYLRWYNHYILKKCLVYKWWKEVDEMLFLLPEAKAQRLVALLESQTPLQYTIEYEHQHNTATYIKGDKLLGSLSFFGIKLYRCRQRLYTTIQENNTSNILLPHFDSTKSTRTAGGKYDVEIIHQLLQCVSNLLLFQALDALLMQLQCNLYPQDVARALIRAAVQRHIKFCGTVHRKYLLVKYLRYMSDEEEKLALDMLNDRKL